MIIFGTKSSKGQTVQSNVLCTNCKTAGQIIFQTSVRCFHVFWIPFFPIQKIAVGQCQHCQKVYKSASFTPEMKTITNDLMKSQKLKARHFLGLLIIAFIILIQNLAMPRMNKKVEEMKAKEEFLSKLNNPLANDIYYVKYGDTTIDNNLYKRSLIFKVYNVTGDTVNFNLSKLLKLDKKISGGYISREITNDFFAEDNIYQRVIMETKTTLLNQKMINNLEIYRIER